MIYFFSSFFSFFSFFFLFSLFSVGDLHGDQNIFYLASGEMIYPASAVLVIYDPRDHTQRFFDKHDDDVSGMAIHPDGEIVASGQVGHAPVSLFFFIFFFIFFFYFTFL